MPKIVDHDERRDELADAVLKIVAEIGINGVTVRAVASEAGWSPGVITHYFGNRREMLLGGLRRAGRITGDRQLKLLERSADDPVGSLQHILEEVLPLDPPRVALSRVYLFFYSEAAADETVKDEVAGALGRWRACVAEAFRGAQEQGFLDARFDPKVAADDLVARADGIAMHALFDPALLARLCSRSPAAEWLADYKAVTGPRNKSRVGRTLATGPSASSR